MRQEILKENTMELINEVISKYNNKQVSNNFVKIKTEMTKLKDEKRMLVFALGEKEMRIMVNYNNLKDNEMPILNGTKWVMLKISQYRSGQFLGVLKDFFIPFNQFAPLLSMAHSEIQTEDLYTEVRR